MNLFLLLKNRQQCGDCNGVISLRGAQNTFAHVETESPQLCEACAPYNLRRDLV